MSASPCSIAQSSAARRLPDLGVEHGPPVAGRVPPVGRLRPGRQRQEVLGMPPPRRIVAAGGQLLGRELAHRLQHREARRGVGIERQQARRDSRLWAVSDSMTTTTSGRRRAVDAGARSAARPCLRHPADRLRGLQGAAADEGPEAPEDRLLRGAEQVVAPGDRVAHRPVARRRVALPAGELGQPLVQPGQQRGGGEERAARRRQLDRQGQPVQPPADLGDGRRVVGCQRERGCRCWLACWAKSWTAGAGSGSRRGTRRAPPRWPGAGPRPDVRP